MGQAKQRGNFEQRKALALERNGRILAELRKPENAHRPMTREWNKGRRSIQHIALVAGILAGRTK